MRLGLLAETGNGFKYNTSMYTLYLRCEDTILAILCKGLSITTTIAGKKL